MVFDVIVVGGGIAGLTATAYAAKSGRRVLLLEKNEKCGGLVNSFERDGFMFDGGVRSLENAGMIIPMLRDLGIEMEFMRSPVSIGMEDKVIHINSRDNLNDYRLLLQSLYPNSIEDVDEVIRIINKIMDEMEVLYGVDNPLFLNLKRDRSKILSYGPWFIKFLKTIQAMKKMNEPVEPFLRRHLSDSALIDIISQHFFKGTPAFFAMSYFYLYTDYMYPKGGIGKLAEAVEKKAVEFGSEISRNTRAAKVIPAKKMIIDDNGNSYTYSKMIWAADLKTLYASTETEGLSKRVIRNFKAEKEKVLRGKGSDSVFTLFLGVDESPETFAEIAKGHLFYTPSREGIGEIYRSDLDSILNNWENVSKRDLLNWIDSFCSLNTYEILIPALRDPDTAPAGKTGLIISLLFEHELVRKVSESGWYGEFKDEMANKMIKTLSNTVYPNLEKNVIFSIVSTPLTIEQIIGSSQGSIVGWSFTEPIPVTSDMLSVKNSVKTSLPDILKAGQWSYSPAGIPTSIMTGRLAVLDALGR